jgi:hypothetical protein
MSSTTNWKQLASEYGISNVRTFKRMIAPIMEDLRAMMGTPKQKTITPKMKEEISNFLGEPTKTNKN